MTIQSDGQAHIGRKNGVKQRQPEQTKHGPTAHAPAHAHTYASLSHVIGTTMSGTIERTPAVMLVAPVSVTFENLAELGRRALNEDAYVVGSVAKRYAGEAAYLANVAFTALTIVSLGREAQRALFSELTKHLLIHGDPTGLESLYLSSWQQVWPYLTGSEQQLAADLWNTRVKNSPASRKHGVVGIDTWTNTVLYIDPHLLEQAGTITGHGGGAFDGGFGPHGRPSGDLGDGVGSGLPDGQGFPSNPSGGGFSQSGFPGTSSSPTGSSHGATPEGDSPFGTSSGFGSSETTGGPSLGTPSFGSGQLGGSNSDPSRGSPGGSKFGEGNAMGGGSNTLSGQDSHGPMGSIITGLDARMDKMSDAKDKQSEGKAMAGFGAFVGVVGVTLMGLGVYGKDPVTVTVGAGVAVAGGLIALAGVAMTSTGEQEEHKIEAEEREKKAADQKKPNILPPDLLNQARFVRQALTLQRGDVLALGAGRSVTVADSGLQTVTRQIVQGEGITALLMTDPSGRVHVPPQLQGRA